MGFSYETAVSPVIILTILYFTAAYRGFYLMSTSGSPSTQNGKI